MDGGRRVALKTERVLQLVGRTLRLDEDENEARLDGVEEADEEGGLIAPVHELDGLLDVLGSRADTANGEENVVVKKIRSEALDLLGEGRAKHKGLAVAGQVLLLDNATNLRLETHVQHAVSLVKDEKLDTREANPAALHEVKKAAGSSHQQVAAALEVAELRADVGATVDDNGLQARAVAELDGLVVDLGRELARRRKAKRVGVRLAGAVGLLRDDRAVVEHARDSREEEPTGLPRTGLGAGHHVTLGNANG
mmetsp:Transcript_13693/g.38880  ORF Transcript_13693/g.38880 Transcript_13693/m.38880 type:complete len:253 (+) Transcript_13693:743-1501(+)